MPQLAEEDLVLRIPPTPPDPPGPLRRIRFKHPGYPDEHSHNTILHLPVVDGNGLHHMTAHTACALLACNAWDGYFTLTRDGDKLDLSQDDLLKGTDYYFHVPGQARYPVYPSFRHWSFPQIFPPGWPQPDDDSITGDVECRSTPTASGFAKAVLIRDSGCVISKDRDFVQSAHICPASEATWFHNNGLSVFNLNQELSVEYITNDMSNALSLRPDIHKSFDAKQFVIVPKKGQWVPHFLISTKNLCPQYHNTMMTLHPQVSPRCLLARFAWAIFPLVKAFLTKNVLYRVRVMVWENGAWMEVDKDMSGDEVKKTIADSAQSRGPKKRKGQDTPEEEEGDAEPRRKKCRTRKASPPSSFHSSPPLPATHTPPSSFSPPPGKPKYVYPNPYEGRAEKVAEDIRISDLKLRWRERQRPTDPKLLCCDYSAAARGEIELCGRCLGFQFAGDDEEELSGAGEGTGDESGG